jgi:peroxiredoxin
VHIWLNALDTNDNFPALGIQFISGEKIQLPECTSEGYGVFLVSSVHWCPFCNQQLADFQSSSQNFESEGTKIVAGSVDSVEKAKETVQKVEITYPAAYGLDVEKVFKATWAYYDPEKKFLHAAGFAVRPDNSVAVTC